MSLNIPHLDVLAAPLLVAAWTMRGPLRYSVWPSVVALLYFGRFEASTVLSNIRLPRQWDFGCFWLYGQLAAAHKNIYDPAVYAHVRLPFVPEWQFIDAVLGVGFPYPPPTIALFLPLGYIHNLSIGLALWYGVEFVALGAAAWILARYFMPEQHRRAAVLIVAIVMALPSTQVNLGNAQTNFLLLFAIALVFVQRRLLQSAVWLTLAIWIKPYVGILFLLDIIRGQWRRLLVAATTVVVSFGVAALILGPTTMLTYVRSNPGGREPAFAFVESVNQSLLAVILRSQTNVPVHVSVLHEPIFIGIALVMLAVTTFLCFRASRNSDLAFGLSLLLGMLVYPGTLASYGIMLILPLLIVWRSRDRLPGNCWTVIIATACVTIAQGTFASIFAGNLALWLFCAGAMIAQAETSPVAFGDQHPAREPGTLQAAL